MQWSPYPFQTYTRCWRAFICCGWRQGSISSQYHHNPQQCGRYMEICRIPGLLLYWNNIIVQRLRLQTLARSTTDICKVLENIHMLWMDIRIHHNSYAVSGHKETSACINTTMHTYFGNLLKSWVTAAYWKQPHCPVIEAPDPHRMVSVSTRDI